MLILILKSLGLAYVISKMEFCQWPLEALKSQFKTDSMLIGLIVNLLYLMMTCFMCLSFWIGLMIGGIWVGVSAYIISTIIEKITYRLWK